MAAGAAAGKKVEGWLSRRLAAHPVATNCAASGLLSALAEVLRHLLTAKPGARVDLVGAIKQFLIGTGVIAPLATGYNNVVVERLFRGWQPGRPSTVLAQTAAEQALFAPVINVSYMVSLGVLDGRTPAEVWQELREKFLIVMRGNVAFWGPANLVTYRFVPPQWRPLFGKVLSVFWMMILIQKTSRAVEANQAEEKRKEVLATNSQKAKKHNEAVEDKKKKSQEAEEQRKEELKAKLERKTGSKVSGKVDGQDSPTGQKKFEPPARAGGEDGALRHAAVAEDC